MFIFGIFSFFSCKRSENIPSIHHNAVSRELEIRGNRFNPPPPPSNNLTDLILARSNITLPASFSSEKNKTTDFGADIRQALIDLESRESLLTIQKNMAKMELLSFLENPRIPDVKKLEKIRDPENAELLFGNGSSKLQDDGIWGFRIGAGGLDKWDDFVHVIL
jgi:hypothetical protein